MKIIVCEMCGAHDFKYINNQMECLYCGTKYYKEEISKSPVYYNGYKEISFENIPSPLWEPFSNTLKKTYKKYE